MLTCIKKNTKQRKWQHIWNTCSRYAHHIQVYFKKNIVVKHMLKYAGRMSLKQMLILSLSANRCWGHVFFRNVLLPHIVCNWSDRKRGWFRECTANCRQNMQEIFVSEQKIIKFGSDLTTIKNFLQIWSYLTKTRSCLTRKYITKIGTFFTKLHFHH